MALAEELVVIIRFLQNRMKLCGRYAPLSSLIRQNIVVVYYIFCDTKKFSRIFRGNRIIPVSIVSQASLTAVSRTGIPDSAYKSCFAKIR